MALRERPVDALVSLPGDHHHDVEAPREGHLSHGQQHGRYARLDLQPVVRGQVGQAVEHQHSYLVN